MQANKPFLRWAGSKRKLVPKLIEYWDDSYNRYVEPFMGSACLFFAISPKKALLNDINHDLIGAYQSIKDNPILVHKRLQKIRSGKRSYYALREMDPNQLDQFDAAARFIYLNRFCFNGLYRTNEAGKFNVPYAPEGTGSLPTKDELIKISDVLYRKRIENKDFEVILREETKSGDFVYLDPPYAVRNRRIFRQYGADTFGLDDIKRLSGTLTSLDKRGIPFVLSYAQCSEAKNAFKKWDIRQVYTQRNISGFADNRRKAAEILVTNF